MRLQGIRALTSPCLANFRPCLANSPSHYVRCWCHAGSAKSASSKHPLQELTDQYLNEPAKDDLTWSPADPPPNVHSAADGATLAPTDPLAAWICSEGGYVNRHLSLGTSPTLGCRHIALLATSYKCSHTSCTPLLHPISHENASVAEPCGNIQWNAGVF